MAQDLGIKAAAIFDGDAEGIAAFKQCSLEFILNRQILLKKLSTSDIRDKPRKDKDEKEKLGMFDKDWQLKPDHADEWHALLNEITAFLR